MKINYLAAACSLVLTLGAWRNAAAQAALVFDDFLFDNASSPGNNLPGFPAQPGFLEWRVTDGFVDLVGPATIPSGDLFGRYVDLVGSPIVNPTTGLTEAADPGLFSYALPLDLAANTSYTLSFFYNSVDGQANSARVTLVDQSFTVFSSTSAFTQFSREFTFAQAVMFIGGTAPVSESPLTFQDLGTSPTDFAGIGIDRVMLNPTAPVPEPGTFFTIGIGVLVLGFLGRRHFRRA